MAPYFRDPLDQDEEQTQLVGGANSSTSSGTPSGTPSGGVALQTQENTTQKGNKGLNTGSGFQNLDSYLNTNNAKQFGQQVVGKVGDQVTDAKTHQNEAASQFQNQVQSANVLPSNEQVNQAIANPEKADQNAFQSWMKEQYTGPKALSESQAAWNQYWGGTNQANTSAGLLGNEQGRFSLLDQYFGRPQYNFGEKSLDNLLVQRGGVGNDIRQVQGQAQALNQQGKDQERNLQGVASQRAGAVEQNKNNVLNAIGVDSKGQVVTEGSGKGAIGREYQDVYDRLAMLNSQRQLTQRDVQDALKSGKLTSEQIKQLGLNGNESIYDLDLNKYLTLGQDLTRDQAMSPEQRARIRALSQLAGVQDTFAQNEGSETAPAYTFDRARYLADVANAEERYKQDYEGTARDAGQGGTPTTLENARQKILEAYTKLQEGTNDAPYYQHVIDTLEPWLKEQTGRLMQKYGKGRQIQRIQQ